MASPAFLTCKWQNCLKVTLPLRPLGWCMKSQWPIHIGNTSRYRWQIAESHAGAPLLKSPFWGILVFSLTLLLNCVYTHIIYIYIPCTLFNLHMYPRISHEFQIYDPIFFLAWIPIEYQHSVFFFPNPLLGLISSAWGEQCGGIGHLGTSAGPVWSRDLGCTPHEHR